MERKSRMKIPSSSLPNSPQVPSNINEKENDSNSLYESVKRALDKYDPSILKPILTIALLVCYVICDLMLRYLYIKVIDPALNTLGLNIDENISGLLIKSTHLYEK